MKGYGFGLTGEIVVGIIGALAGGWLAGTFFNAPNPIGGFNLTTIIVAFLGAVVAVFIVRSSASLANGDSVERRHIDKPSALTCSDAR